MHHSLTGSSIFVGPSAVTYYYYCMYTYAVSGTILIYKHMHIAINVKDQRNLYIEKNILILFQFLLVYLSQNLAVFVPGSIARDAPPTVNHYTRKAVVVVN